MDASLPTPTGPRVRWDRRARRTGGHVHKGSRRHGSEKNKHVHIPYCLCKRVWRGGRLDTSVRRQAAAAVGTALPPTAAPSQEKNQQKRNKRTTTHKGGAVLRTAPHPCLSSTLAKKAPLPPNTSTPHPHDVQTDRQTDTDSNKHARKQNQHTRNMTRIKERGSGNATTIPGREGPSAQTPPRRDGKTGAPAACGAERRPS